MEEEVTEDLKLMCELGLNVSLGLNFTSLLYSKLSKW